MNAPANLPSYGKLSEAYRMSRQRLGDYARRFGRLTVHDPDKLFQAVCQANKLAVLRLIDPAERARIKSELAKLNPNKSKPTN